NDDLRCAIAQQVGDDRRRVGEVGPQLGVAVGVAAQVAGLGHIGVHLAPVSAAKLGVGGDLRAVVVVGGDVVHIAGTDDRAAPIVVDVAQGDVLVISAGGVAQVAALQ